MEIKKKSVCFRLAFHVKAKSPYMSTIENKDMYLFTTADMQFDYLWTQFPENDPRISGAPDKTRFNRNEGHEMLYLINQLAQLWHLRQICSCLKIERMLKEALPERLVKQEIVMEWIRKNWDRY